MQLDGIDCESGERAYDLAAGKSLSTISRLGTNRRQSSGGVGRYGRRFSPAEVDDRHQRVLVDWLAGLLGGNDFVGVQKVSRRDV